MPFTPKISSNSPYCLAKNSYDFSSENLTSTNDPLITCLLDIVLTLQGEILSWSLMGVKVLSVHDKNNQFTTGFTFVIVSLERVVHSQCVVK